MSVFVQMKAILIQQTSNTFPLRNAQVELTDGNSNDTPLA